jgi:hypothetical protein
MPKMQKFQKQGLCKGKYYGTAEMSKHRIYKCRICTKSTEMSKHRVFKHRVWPKSAEFFKEAQNSKDENTLKGWIFQHKKKLGSRK